MKKNKISIIILHLFVFGIIRVNAQTISASNNLVAQPIPDRTVSYSVSDTGVAKPVTFGLDLAWLSEANIRRGIAFMGKPQVRLIRSSFTPTDSLINGELKPNEMNILNQRLNIINTWMGPTTIALNDDNPSVSSWYKNADGSFNAARWAQLIDVTTRHHQEQGHTVITVGPFNEPDYPTGQGSMQDFYNIAGELKNNPRFSNIRIGGGNTLNCDQALPWYNFLKDRLDEGNTHQLAGSFDNFASFYQTVRANGHHATGDELHNVMEAMVGVEYGMQTGIWWGTAELARGEFVKASDGKRLGYAEHRPNWTAASVYRGTDGKVKAFGGTSERQATTTTYRFVSKDRDVYYDGYGPQREYTMVMPGGTGYGQGQTNAERVVNITWGDDIQPAINGRYVLVNRNSGMVMEVAGGSATAGVNIQQGANTGATYQQWNVTPVDSRVGGDFSYFTFTAVHSGKAADILNFSLDNGANIIAWNDVKNENQQWYLDYAGDGWFYIRSRHSAKCLDVFNASTGDGANIVQWDVNGGTNQQWRFLPVGAPIEFVAPSAPGNLVATAHAESIRLDWTASPETDVAGYTIFRSESAGGPYNTIARNVTSTSFVDNTTTTGGQFFYKIKAVDNSVNRSTYSNEASATATGDSDLVVHLPFNGNTRDTSINLNHAASLGGISFSTGKVGSGAIVLNGTDAFLQLPATLANQQEITIATWVYWNGGAAWQRIFDFGNDQSQYMFLTPSSGIGTLRFAIKNSGAEQLLDAPALPTGVWSHVAVTLGSSGARMYVNGQLVTESNAITIRPLDFKPVLNYIGRSQYPDPLLQGSVDEFKIYNRALSMAELGAAMKIGQTITFNALDSVGVLHADFSPGATVSSGLMVTYTSFDSSVATIVNGNIHTIGVGTTTITASQAGNNTYNAVTPVSQTLKVYDNIVPSQPQGLTVVQLNTTGVQLNWIASTDNVAVVGYYVYKNSTLLNTKAVTANSYIAPVSAIGVVDTFTVVAVDAAQNRSVASAAVLYSTIQSYRPMISNSRPLKFCAGDSTIFTCDTSGTYQWYFNGTSLNGATGKSFTAKVAGYYYVVVDNGSGTRGTSSGDTVVVYALPAKPTIAWSGSQFSTSAAGVSYQWLLHNTAITGATASIYKPAGIGNYKIEVIDGNGCVNVSDSFALVVTAVNTPVTTSGDHIARLFPNPATRAVTVQFEQAPVLGVTIQLFGASGQILKQIITNNQTNIISLNGIMQGVYFLKITGKKYNQVQQFIISK